MHAQRVSQERPDCQGKPPRKGLRTAPGDLRLAGCAESRGRNLEKVKGGRYRKFQCEQIADSAVWRRETGHIRLWRLNGIHGSVPVRANSSAMVVPENRLLSGRTLTVEMRAGNRDLFTMYSHSIQMFASCQADNL